MPEEETPAAPAADAPKVFDETYVKGLRSESAGYRTKANALEAELETIRAELDAARSEVANTVPDLEARATAAELKALTLEVVLDTGLPMSLVDRLRGTTAEELTADAKNLVSMFGQNTPPPADYGQGSTEGDTPPAKSDPSAAMRAAFGYGH